MKAFNNSQYVNLICGTCWAWQVRALMFVTGITSEILCAMGDVEGALQEAARHQTPAWPGLLSRRRSRPRARRCARRDLCCFNMELQQAGSSRLPP